MCRVDSRRCPWLSTIDDSEANPVRGLKRPATLAIVPALIFAPEPGGVLLLWSSSSMDLYAKQIAWWSSLTEAQRREAASVRDALPPWMVESLTACGLVTAAADLTGHSPVALMTTYLREFVASRTQD